MLDLKEHFASNFNMWSFNENKIKKEKNGKKKSMLIEDVKFFILSDGKDEETIENKSPTIIEVNI
jgi:hypothetical protein